MYDGGEVKEITAARTPMKNNKRVCVTCNQTFATKNWFKKHIQEEDMIPAVILGKDPGSKEKQQYKRTALGTQTHIQ